MTVPLGADSASYMAAEQMLLSFTTDVYYLFDTNLTRPTIEILKEYGLSFCALTKGGTCWVTGINWPLGTDRWVPMARDGAGGPAGAAADLRAGVGLPVTVTRDQGLS